MTSLTIEDTRPWGHGEHKVELGLFILETDQ